MHKLLNITPDVTTCNSKENKSKGLKTMIWSKTRDSYHRSARTGLSPMLTYISSVTLLFALLLPVVSTQSGAFYGIPGDWCRNRPQETCCRGRYDECSVKIMGTLCYCDQFCNRAENPDCCPDYWSTCLDIPPGPPTPPHSPPVIKEHPTDVVVRRNEPATLNCAASDYSRVRWYHNGEIVEVSPEDPRSHRRLLPSGSLFFLRVVATRRDNDAGVYYCVASNAHGATRSNNAILTVATLGVDFQVEPGPLIIARWGHHGVALRCRPPIGTPKPVVFWLKNSELVSNSSRIYTMLNGDLVVNDAIESDSGTYTCVARNVAAVRESTPTKLFFRDHSRESKVGSHQRKIVPDYRDAEFNFPDIVVDPSCKKCGLCQVPDPPGCRCRTNHSCLIRHGLRQ